MDTPHWPCRQAVVATAHYKMTPTDFQVCELPLPAADIGRNCSDTSLAHCLLEIEKTGLNTQTVAQWLATWCDVPLPEVGYAGRKDRWGVTRQWYTVPAAAYGKHADPVAAFANFANAQQPSEGAELAPQIHICSTAWQPRKLRIGELAGNRFQIRLRITQELPAAEINAALERLQAQGAPNYFGPQRFGHDNLASALNWLQAQQAIKPSERRTRRRGAGSRGRGRGQSRGASGWHLSTLRAYLFNQVLSARLQHDRELSPVEGEALLGNAASGPLWGRGRNPASGMAAQLEAHALAPYAMLMDALEHTGATQMRRRLLVIPEDFSWELLTPRDLTLQFSLPSGAYASVVLAELFDLTDASNNKLERVA